MQKRSKARSLQAKLNRNTSKHNRIVHHKHDSRNDSRNDSRHNSRHNKHNRSDKSFRIKEKSSTSLHLHLHGGESSTIINIISKMKPD